MSRQDFRTVLVILLILAGGMLGVFDRVAFSILAPIMKHDLSLTDTDLGFAFSAFSLGYMSFVLIGGWCADRFRLGNLLLAVVLAWSVTCAMTALSTGLASLILIRLLFGASESPWQPAANKTLAELAPPDRFVVVFGIVTAGQPLGGAIAAPTTALLAARLDWQAVFVAIGALGLVWAAGWALVGMKILRDRPATAIEPEPGTATAQGGERPGMRDVLRSMRDRSVLAIAFGYAMTMYLLTYFQNWWPSYLLAARGVKLQEMGFLASVPWLGATVALLLSGFLSHAIVSRSDNPLRTRKYLTAAIAAMAGLCVIAVPFMHSALAAVAMMTLGMSISYFAGGNYFAMLLQVQGRRSFGAATGCVMICGNITGILASVASGALIDRFGGYTASLVVTGAAMLAGASALLLFVRSRSVESAADLPAVVSVEVG